MRRGNAFLVGLFVVIGLALVAAGVLAATGGKLFSRQERAVIFFDTSVYGLQVGSPVVFRGVRMGSVVQIGLFHDEAGDRYAIPVIVELEREGITTVHTDGRRERNGLGLPQLVARGLTAQLAMQSLLTGQLYVDLDLRPGKPSVRRGTHPTLTEIPTSVATIQNLKAQLEGLDLRAVVDDVSQMARSARELVGSPELKHTLADVRQTAVHLRSLSARLNERAGPLTAAAQATMTDARQALGQVGRAADHIGTAAGGIGDAAGRIGGVATSVGELVRRDAPMVRSLEQAADDLARTAANLRVVTGSDAPLVEGLQRTLDDVSRASRAVRELADLLDRHPDALLRGRPAPESER